MSGGATGESPEAAVESDPGPKVVFIGGLGRSGSTLLERVLASLPGVCALGEVSNLWKRMLHYPHERCGCGNQLSTCGFWNAVGNEAFGGWHRPDLGRIVRRQQELERIRDIPWLARSRMGPRRRELVTAHTNLYHRLYRAAAAVSGAQVVVDSSKRPGLAFCLRWSTKVDVLVVHLVRDPRGVAYSSTKHVDRQETDRSQAGGRALMPRLTPSRSAINWLTHNTAMSVLSHSIGQAENLLPRTISVQRLRYEQFLAEPVSTVSALATEVGLTVGENDLAYLRDGSATLEPIHSVAGNPMRFTTGRVALRTDDAWRRRLPPRQRRMVAALCLPLLSAYGYPLRAGQTQRAAG